MNPSLIKTVLDWMQNIEVGPGDLTTESVSPYALHSVGSFISKSDGIFSGRDVLEILFESSGKQLKVEWNVNEGDALKTDDILFEFQGNGIDILQNRRLIQWLIGRMSGIATSTKEASEYLESRGKQLVQGARISPIFEVFDRIAFKTGGGIWKRQGLTDSIYLTQQHAQYVGSIEKCLKQVNKELGDTRKAIKIEVEVNTAAQFKQINELDYDVMHLIGMASDQIRDIFEKANPLKKPVLHLENLTDFQEKYTDYFFKYCAVEQLHSNIQYLSNEMKIQGGGVEKNE
ncbi:hypothetical protein KJ656_05975 [bacterium]|nr:hypothetical protein [bacterium]